ncbi:MAG: sporulation initiation factor Spo0A C-terminal domain-containing protein [Lachnospiraceae bacterium]|nr:sporulation initiation factor Spo0A C-terminal domain-containing protein [Lachnospiraceae bacterium]
MDIANMNEVDLERYVTRIMLDMGIPAHLKGYHYLREAIILSGKDMEAVSSVTKLLYPTVAKRFKTTDQKVERAIRNAIEVSWTRGNIDTFEELFGYSVGTGKGRPTNSEYIARIADKIRLDLRDL